MCCGIYNTCRSKMFDNNKTKAKRGKIEVDCCKFIDSNKVNQQKR